MVEKSDFEEMLIKDMKVLVLKKIVSASTPDDHSLNGRDSSRKMDEIEKEKDDEEYKLSDCVEHDKKYFFVHSAEIGCKLCSFKGKLIVEHYRTSHPESEVLISRINPDIVEILIEDAIRNREEYDKNHPELEQMTCNFKCPFCLMLIKDTANMFYNHISSHTGEFCFHCNHCSYWTYNHTNIHSHLNQIHYKIQNTDYKKVYLEPKLSKYVFGYICSECNFIQLNRATVEEHAMVYHPGIEIHKVNLGVLLHEDVVEENHTNENYLNLNCINAIMSGSGETQNHISKTSVETKELSNLLVQMEELEEVKVKIEPKKLNDLRPIEVASFICQPDLEIKEDSETDRTEMLQWINKNTRKLKTSISDHLQIKLVTEMVEETETIQKESEEPNNTSEEMEKLNGEVDPLEQPEKSKKSVEMIEIGPISVTKEFNVFMFHCKIQNCNYFSEDKRAFAVHCEITHRDFFYIFSTGECNICLMKFEYKGKYITIYDIYLHIVTMHKDFFEPESSINYKLMNDIPNVLSQTYDNPMSECPFITSNVTSLASKSDMNSVGAPLLLTPFTIEDKEEMLCSQVKFPMIASVQLLLPKTEQLVSTSRGDSKCASVLTDILMTDIDKQNRKCPKAVAAMMKSPLLSALYKCPQYDCSFATMLPLSFQEHFMAHHSILMDALVPCLYCDYKVLGSSYVTHLEVRHDHCIFGCGDCFYRTTNSYFVTIHHELMHPNTEFNILQLEVVVSNRINTDTTPINFGELVWPYNCKDDGFLNCPFKTLYFEEYLKHVGTTHEVDGFCSFSSELEPLREAIMEEWLVKEVGPFQCSYCKKATVTHQEMGRHQAVFHAQEQCLFYYRKFVPNDTVIIPEQVNLEDPSFINHVIHLPNQIHLCNFKLTDGLLSSISAKLTNWESKVSLPLLPPHVKDTETDLDQLSVSLEEPEGFTVLVNDEIYPLEESDSLSLDEQPKDGESHNDITLTALKLQCKWKGCYQTYHSQMALVKHIEKNHISSQKGEEFICFWIKCQRKSEPFATKRNLLVHMRVHSGEKPHKCLFQGCNKAFSQSGYLKIHEKIHTGERPYMCQFSNCFKRFSSIPVRDYHQRMHYDAEFYPCQVTGCSKKYAGPNSLRKHMKSHTVDEQLEVKQKSVEKKQKVDDLMLKKPSDSSDGRTHYNMLQCKWKACYQTCQSQTSLVKHIEKNHVRLQRGEEFTCFWNNCPRKSKPYTSKQNLLIHMRAHSGEKPHKCPFQGCQKAFTRFANLKTHQRRHTGERPYLCQFPNCFESFSISSLRDYHQTMHYDAEAYACQVTGCSKKYTGPSSLRKHMKTHTVDEQLEVKRESVDNKVKDDDDVLKSSNGSDGDKHQRTQCDTLQCKWKGCSQTYHSQVALVKHIKKSHMRLRKGEKLTCLWINCPRKSKPFANKSNLLGHMRIHSGEKPYKCPDCDKAFSELGTLKSHQRRHTGERPHVCQFSNCFKSFSTSSSRDYHQRTHYDREAYTYKFVGTSKKNANTNTLQKHSVVEQLDTKREPVENKEEDDYMLEKSSNSLDRDKHQRTHCDTLQCEWKGCYQTYNSQTALVKHIEQKHVQLQKGEEFTCLWINCPRNLKPLVTKYELSSHMKIHSKEKPYKCLFQDCNKVFAQLVTLKKHQRQHTGEGKYLCRFPNCFKSFSSSTRNIHQKNHLNAKCYACQVTSCSKKYAQLSKLQKHMEKHGIDEKFEVKQKSVEDEQKENDFIIYHI